MGTGTVTIGPQTLGSLKAMITRYHKEQEDDALLTDAANDAMESLWRNVLLVSLGQFMGGPITSLTIAAGSERAQIISLSDPTTPLTPGVVAGGALADRNIDIAYSFVTVSGSETLISPIVDGFNVPPGNLIVVPGPPDFIAAQNEDPDVIGYNIYACIHGLGVLAKQNSQPIPFNITWTEPADTGVQNLPNFPPIPSSNTTGDNIFYIRVLQVQNPDGTWTTWQAASIDELLFARATRSIAAATSYQGYAYDVINGNTIEIRPAAGQSLNPRYFFVRKPRRLLYDNASIPFTNFSNIEYLKMYADAALDLANHEYTGYGIKSRKAASILQEILQGMNQQSTVKQKTITPYMGW